MPRPTLIVFYSSQHLLHAPRREVWGGKATPHPEVPARAQGILEALEDQIDVQAAKAALKKGKFIDLEVLAKQLGV